MTEPPAAAFVVAFVVGVTPGKWARVWAERLPRQPLELRLLAPAEALAALYSGDVDAAFLRFPSDGPTLRVDDEAFSAIPLYTETAVAVIPKDHAAEALDSLSLADLAGEQLIEGPWAEAVELVAAGAGLAVMPHAVARALSRKDVVNRPLVDGPEHRVALVWPTASTTTLVEEFTGIVRGRTANSSRGEPTPPAPKQPRRKQAKPDRRPSRRR